MKSGIKQQNTNSGSLGQFLKSRAKFIHVSCTSGMRQDPVSLRHIPWISKGTTLNLGRNKAKRLARAS